MVKKNLREVKLLTHSHTASDRRLALVSISLTAEPVFSTFRPQPWWLPEAAFRWLLPSHHGADHEMQPRRDTLPAPPSS